MLLAHEAFASFAGNQPFAVLEGLAAARPGRR
jgi:hypothetical protein